MLSLRTLCREFGLAHGLDPFAGSAPETAAMEQAACRSAALPGAAVRRIPAQGDIDIFRAALVQDDKLPGRTESESRNERVPEAPAWSLMPTPLMHRDHSSDLAGPAVSLAPIQGGSGDLCKLIVRLCVNTAATGRREARITLSESVFPKTSVSVSEESGRIAVEFHCAAQATQAYFCSRAHPLASELASALRRSVVLRVGGSDQGTPLLAQAYADAPEPSMPDDRAAAELD
jgi:hypothetical protein